VDVAAAEEGAELSDGCRLDAARRLVQQQGCEGSGQAEQCRVLLLGRIAPPAATAAPAPAAAAAAAAHRRHGLRLRWRLRLAVDQ
jgi:hypothetical protein